MKLAVIGCGHVGLVAGTCFAESGHEVICSDIDSSKIDTLRGGKPTFFEPGLEELMGKNMAEGRLSFTDKTAEAVAGADVVFVSVNTPPLETGQADLRFVEQAARDIGQAIDAYRLVVNISTVPVGTVERLGKIIAENTSAPFDIASNPEFLREGSAIYDRMKPDRIVIGANSEKAIDLLRGVYEKIDAPVLVTTIRTAEMIKYASNAFLATKISFINEISHVCELVGADVVEVAEGMGLDPRIGNQFLKAGLGYGGSCFPKDTRALDQICSDHGHDFDLLKAVIEVNWRQRTRFVDKVRAALGGSLEGATIGMLGLSFKPDTDDLRESAALDIIALLKREGATVKAYDPVAMAKAKEASVDVEFCDDPYAACLGSDLLAITTECREFRELDFAKVRELLCNPIVIDGRNLLDPQTVKANGLTYSGVGRPALTVGDEETVAAP